MPSTLTAESTSLASLEAGTVRNALSPRGFARWMDALIVLTLATLVVGGLTRLTGSGLSMVEWEAILGWLPPLSAEAWEAAFDQYRAYPEYQLRTRGMSLGEFKFIYYWEYAHRVLARVVGLAALVPLVGLGLTRRLSSRQATVGSLAFLMVAAQGILGWYMVDSGLVDVPEVSHYRLAAHLSLALVLFSYLAWQRFRTRLRPEALPAEAPRWRIRLLLFLGLCWLQILYGAFVAGLRAGYMHNTWPRMDGRWWHPGMFAQGVWISLHDDPTTVQFVHRWLGAVILLVAVVLVFTALGLPRGRFRGALLALGGVVGIQFLLGVLTLVLAMPIALASLHQLAAALLLGVALYALHLAVPPAPFETEPT